MRLFLVSDQGLCGDHKFVVVLFLEILLEHPDARYAGRIDIV